MSIRVLILKHTQQANHTHYILTPHLPPSRTRLTYTYIQCRVLVCGIMGNVSSTFFNIYKQEGKETSWYVIKQSAQTPHSCLITCQHPSKKPSHASLAASASILPSLSHDLTYSTQSVPVIFTQANSTLRNLE